MKNIVGIDLGTTFSAIAHLNSLGKPEIVPNADGERITPSVVWFDPDVEGRFEVGSQAKNQIGAGEDRVVREAKRHMGETEAICTIDAKSYRPEEISALVIRKLVQDANLKIGDIDEVVITVPAYFEEAHRKATFDAGEIAGLNVKAIVNEPTAAAIFYATQEDVAGKIVVFDLGGGTFDVTALVVAGTNVEIASSYGDRHLGGVDFDRAIVDLANKKYRDKFGEDLPQEGQDAADNMQSAETAKVRLSRADKASMMLMGGSGPLRIEIKRSEFEQSISTYVSKAEMLVESVLDEADWEPSDVDKVLLVGGSCRIPFVQDRIKAIFGFEPTFSGSLVDECVALGAAVYSGLKALESAPDQVSAGIAAGLKDVRVQEVCNHSYGTLAVIRDEETDQMVLQNSVLITKNTPIPVSEARTYFTMYDGQDVVEIKITQGEETDPDRVTVLFKEELKLPPNRPAERPIEVTYSYDANQCMRCSFKDVESGREFDITLTSKDGTGMTANDIDRSKASVESFQIE